MQAEVLKVCDVRRLIPRRRRGTTMHSLIVAHAHAQSQVIGAPQGCSWEEMGNFYNYPDAMCLLVGAELWGRRGRLVYKASVGAYRWSYFVMARHGRNKLNPLISPPRHHESLTVAASFVDHYG